MCLVDPHDVSIEINAKLSDTSSMINATKFIEYFHRCPPLFVLTATTNIDARNRHVPIILDYGDIFNHSHLLTSQEEEEQQQQLYDSNNQDSDYDDDNRSSSGSRINTTEAAT
jgi:hypothetical protein